MAGGAVGAYEVGYIRRMWWQRVEMARSGMGGDFDPRGLNIGGG